MSVTARCAAALGASAAAFLCSALPAGAQVLYDGSLNSAPNAQGWTYGQIPNPTTQPPASLLVPTVAGGTSTLDTTSNNLFYAGYSRLSPTALNRAAGFDVRFDVSLGAESTTNANRSGFSLIVLGSDTRGIELAFEPTDIFAQEGGTSPNLFTKAESALFANTSTAGATGQAGLNRFDVFIGGGTYKLFANLPAGQTPLTTGLSPLLQGSLRDYSAATTPTGVPNPYSIPNFLFFGDDTQEASARFSVARVEVTASAAPEPGSLALLAPAAGAILLARRRRGDYAAPDV